MRLPILLSLLAATGSAAPAAENADAITTPSLTSFASTYNVGKTSLESVGGALTSTSPGVAVTATAAAGFGTTCPAQVTVTVTQTVTAGSASATPSAYSPPEYPSPETRGEGAWSDAIAKAKARLSTWTLEQKVNLTTGTGWEGSLLGGEYGRCVGDIAAQPDVNFPGLCLEDSPTGVRFADFVSVFPAGINVASTFDRDLMRARGLAMGQEFRGKGVNVALGPDVNLARVPQAGRNWEGYGSDPYLCGEAAYETIKGLQTKGQGVQATVKHFIANELERNRTTASSNIDDRTMHELYLHPFLRAVQADVASVMCSYNLINNSWACQNSKTQNDLLKTELGFQGYIMSDWSATHSGVSAVLAGLDMTMPGDIAFNSDTTYFGMNLTMAVQNGSVPESRVDDMATRILGAYYLLEQDEDFPPVNFDFRDIHNPATNEHVNVEGDHYKIIREIGAASTVLLKNVNNALPLCAPRSIALIGNDAGPSSIGPNGYPDRGGLNGILAIGWGSGTANFPYLIAPLEAIQMRARQDNTSVGWTLNNYDLDIVASTAAFVDAALVFIAADSGEGYITVDGNEGDRNNLTAWDNGNEIVLATAAVNNNTIVVVNSVGPIIMESWIEHPNITAVLWSGLAGQEAGNSLVDVLYGAYNPSARLPYTIAKKKSDYPAQPNFVNTDVPAHPQINYSEGLFIDYRHFQEAGIEPRFGFGFGLSYTTFGYSGLSVNWLDNQSNDKRDSQLWASNGTDSQLPGTDGTELVGVPVGTSVAPWLHRKRYSIEFDLTNTGSVDGCDVPQLYIGFPKSAGEPPKVLRGFTRINLQPGATKHISLPLSKYDLSIWDVITQSWVQPEGEFTVYVGQSAFDTQLQTTFYP